MRTFISIFTLITFYLNVGISQHSLSGEVRNEKGEAIDYASVFLINTNYATTTNIRGKYTLNDIPNGNYQLKVSYVGYESKTFDIVIMGNNLIQDVVLPGTVYKLDEIVINATQTEITNSFATTKINAEDIADYNLGQDIPFLLQQTASLVSTSDAGAGVGYTGMRIRGSDQTRINVTLNGIPVNDAESQSVYWVNMPDLSSSVSNIEIQRGVGTSTNGTGAFGGSVHLNTNDINIRPYAEVGGSYGSFNTSRLNVKLGSGLINDKYSVDARYSTIKSDGFIDRASSDLSSIYLSAARVSANSLVRLNYIAGKEKTYQSWYGTPEGVFKNDLSILNEHYQNNVGGIYFTEADSVNLFTSGETYNYYTYADQVDKYNQDHLQLFTAHRLNDNWVINTTFNYTYGRGFYEEYKVGEDLNEYYDEPVVNDAGQVIEYSDLVRRRWLDNDYLFGSINTEAKLTPKINFISGISASNYLGEHFGRVIQLGEEKLKGEQANYYYGEGNKKEFNIFGKFDIKHSAKFQSYIDLQYRIIDYVIEGDDNKYKGLYIENDFKFFNPKFGLTYQLNENLNLYGSFAVAQREPVRSDIIDNLNIGIESERLHDFEGGIKFKGESAGLNVNLYYMDYDNQLIPTGNLNDVGQAVRENVANSYRMGVELVGEKQFSNKFSINVALTLSQNKITDFDYLLYDYGVEPTGIVVQNFDKTDIAFSPNIICNAAINYSPIQNLKVSLLNNYVGKQYLDNTTNESRKLDAYFVNNLNFTYQVASNVIKDIKIKALVNNIINQSYASNGYTYSYIYGSTITENYYYPQAGINFLVGVDLKF